VTPSVLPDTRNESVVETLEAALSDARDDQVVEVFAVLRTADGRAVTHYSESDDLIQALGFLRLLEAEIIERMMG